MRVVNNIGKRAPCESCNVLREVLDIESQRARYFEQLLLKRAGIVVSEEQLGGAQDYEPVFQRVGTLSEIRRAAERITKAKAENPIASQEELTEAERLFEEQLNG